MHLSACVETRELTGNKNHNDIQKKMKWGERERKMYMKRGGAKALRERESKERRLTQNRHYHDIQFRVKWFCNKTKLENKCA